MHIETCLSIVGAQVRNWWRMPTRC